MAPNYPATDNISTGKESDPAVLDDLRLRLVSSQEQESAARALLRGSTRELALMRRLAKFFFEEAPPLSRAAKPVAIPRGSAAPLAGKMVYHVDHCEPRGEYWFISGWAFCPTPDWDARDTRVTLLFQSGDTTHYAVAGWTLRPDVAAHFASQSAKAAGGARGLDHVGFACEVLRGSLPSDGEWQLGLRLECGRRVCEGPTGQRLAS